MNDFDNDISEFLHKEFNDYGLMMFQHSKMDRRIYKTKKFIY